MAFQWVFDNAATISVNNREIVSLTETRNETIRSVSRGSAVAKFVVSMPAGMQWSVVQTYIAAVDVADRFTVENIVFNQAYMSWMNSTSIVTGSNFNVIATDIPQWTISDIDIVQWSGPFKFTQSLL
tara:strand:+ start:523 stop:903 length:381 start_codon:yes stop_codon:yes gene_type:complete